MPIQPRHGEVIYPPEEVVRRARVKDWEAMARQALEDIEGFWAREAEELEWFQKWEKVLDDSNAPFYKWFIGAKTNIVHNALDRHMKTWRRNKVAFYWVGEPGDTRTISYRELYNEVNRFANVLRGLGVKKGDRVTIYMGRVPEIVVAMLATAKIGAMHSVVYGGFSVDALRERILDSESKVVITQDGGWMRGKVVPLKDTVDEAVKLTPSVEKIVVVQRLGPDVKPVTMIEGRDYWYHDLMASPLAEGPSPTEVMDAEDPLFILYTSGTTGKPKAILHVHGGYMVGTYTALKYVFDLQDDDVWWCAADPGWITGHSFIVYSPLVLGVTSVMYEGAPNYPTPDRWWQIAEKYGVTVFYTAPTAIRGLMRYGEEWVKKHDLSSIRLLGSVGEPINPEAWKWYHRVIGGGKAPIMDTWWQTETGHFMITPVPSVPLKPGSAFRPFFGQEAEVVDDEGNPVPPNTEGYLVLKNPWPAMLRTLYKDPDRYIKTYWSRFPGRYFTGDSAKIDEDGYFWIIGRVDDVIKVSGYRLGTAEIESALVAHPDVVEAAVVGIPHEIKGNAIHAYVVLRAGLQGSPQLEKELIEWVAQHIGKIARPERIHFVEKLPKTRSGKIMRRLLRAWLLGLPEGDTSTLED
ncbi:MAG: acetate--CoA ligase [Chloroflexi bacterium]|nr:acetate--CoA ligase [Chloroflexota bacterium]